jgi:hypothetical protein
MLAEILRGFANLAGGFRWLSSEGRGEEREYVPLPREGYSRTIIRFELYLLHYFHLIIPSFRFAKENSTIGKFWGPKTFVISRNGNRTNINNLCIR